MSSHFMSPNVLCHIFSFLPWRTLLTRCAAVSARWHAAINTYAAAIKTVRFQKELHPDPRWEEDVTRSGTAAVVIRCRAVASPRLCVWLSWLTDVLSRPTTMGAQCLCVDLSEVTRIHPVYTSGFFRCVAGWLRRCASVRDVHLGLPRPADAPDGETVSALLAAVTSHRRHSVRLVTDRGPATENAEWRAFLAALLHPDDGVASLDVTLLTRDACAGFIGAFIWLYHPDGRLGDRLRRLRLDLRFACILRGYELWRFCIVVNETVDHAEVVDLTLGRIKTRTEFRFNRQLSYRRRPPRARVTLRLVTSTVSASVLHALLRACGPARELHLHLNIKMMQSIHTWLLLCALLTEDGWESVALTIYERWRTTNDQPEFNTQYERLVDAARKCGKRLIIDVHCGRIGFVYRRAEC